jgi:putative methylase
MSKKGLAIILSKLELFLNADAKLEQYPTDSEIAADILWEASIRGDISEKTIVDLGCGTGILGLGASLLGAKKVIFVELDKNALEAAISNKRKLEEEYAIKTECVFLNEDAGSFNEHADLVIMNPPFGTKEKNQDQFFLKVAVAAAPVVYSIHKSSTRDFIEKFTSRNKYRINYSKNYAFPLKNTMNFHTRKIHRIEATLFRFEKMQ